MTKLMAIVNVTPDSFSGDGTAKVAEAIDKAIAAGADIIDIGAESTRPGAQPLMPEEELHRLQPAFDYVSCHSSDSVFSLDTYHAETASAGIQAGFSWINDVSGASNNDLLRVVAAHSHCRYVLMHSLSVPANPAIHLASADPLQELRDWAQERVALLKQIGIGKDRIVFDPGIGFGKTAAQSWAILKSVDELKSLGLPLLIGHSRKSFLTTHVTAPAAERDAATLAISLCLAQKNIDYLRVHDIAGHVQTLRTAKALYV